MHTLLIVNKEASASVGLCPPDPLPGLYPWTRRRLLTPDLLLFAPTMETDWHLCHWEVMHQIRGQPDAADNWSHFVTHDPSDPSVNW